MTMICRLVACKNCGAELEHQATGRPREFCSDRCRKAYTRAMKRHAHACVDAALAGEPEPARDFGVALRCRTLEIAQAFRVPRDLLQGEGQG